MASLVVNILFAAVILCMCVFSFIKKQRTNFELPRILESRWVFLFITAVAVFLRFYRLGEIPALDCDEASSMYDAWSIANYGIDRSLYSYPLYFSGLGGGQSPMCIYLLSLVAKVFGYDVLAYRIVFASAGVITALLIYFICIELMSARAAALAYLVAACMPIMVMLSRYCLDCDLMMPFFSATLLFAMKALKRGKIEHFILAGIFGGLTLYTYILSYVIVFIFAVLFALTCIVLRYSNLFRVVAFLLPLAILGVVPAINFMVQMGIMGEISIGPLSIYPISTDRAADFSLSNLFEFDWKLKSLKWLVWPSEEVVYGMNLVPMVYLFSIPLALLGFAKIFIGAFKAFKNRIYEPLTIFAISSVSFLPIVLFMFVFNWTRLNSFAPIYVVATVLGAEALQRRSRVAVRLIVICICCCTIAAGTYFVTEMEQSSNSRWQSDYGLRNVYREIRSVEDDTIWLDPFARGFNGTIPYVVTLGVDLRSPDEVYATTIGLPEYPAYEGVRSYYPFDLAREEFYFNDDDCYLVLSVLESETRMSYRSALEEAGFIYEVMGNFYVYRK